MKAMAKISGWNRVFIIPVIFSICFGLSTVGASPQPVSLRDLAFNAPTGGNGDSGLSITSADGRFTLFASTANNLTLANDNNFVLPRRMNVFLRNRANDTTTLVSINLAGTGGGNGDSFPTGISTNGQFALFESSAGDLVANDTNNATDIFVRDLVNGTTTLVSVNTNGISGNGVSRGSVITPDGRYVAFVSAASDLVSGDLNSIADVFVRDLQTGTTKLVSVGAATNSNVPTPFGVSSSESPEITPDGRYVAFYSTATNLVPNGTTAGEIYVRDLIAGKTIWASTNARAIFQSAIGTTNVVSCNYNISDDGRFVAFEACTNAPTGSSAFGVIARYNLQTGLTDSIYTNAHVPLLSFEKIHDLAMTPDGRFTVFVANVSTAVTAIYLWDAQSGTNMLVSANLNNSGPANGICQSPAVSPNGQFVAFISSATNLVTNTLAGDYHVYVRDMQAAVTQLLDTDTNGNGVGVNPTTIPTLSANGSVVTFESANLLGDNRRQNYDAFVRDLTAGTTGLISVRDPALPSQTPDGISGLTSFPASSNGRFVAFYSDADNLVSNDMNGCRDVFVRNLVAGTNILASINTNGVSGDGISTDPAISAAGRYVAFTSAADDLVAGDANRAQDVFIRDLQNNATTLASVSTDGIHSGNGDSFSPQISANGRYVLFHSKASNVAAGSFSGTENLFFRDLQTGTTYALTSGGVNSAAMTPDSHFVAFIGTATGTSGTGLYVWNSQTLARTYTNSVSFSSGTFPVVAISANGQKLAYLANSPLNLFAADLIANTNVMLNPSGTFLSHPGIQFSGDGRFLVYAAQISPATNQSVYLYDFQAGTNLLVSRNFNSTNAAGGNSDSSSISPDGNFIAYRSFAGNVVSNDFNNVADLFIYDRSNAATLIVSASGSGNFTANDRSLKPVFSGDGQTIFFQSWASDLAGNDFNNGSDIFALNLASFPGGAATFNPSAPLVAQLLPAGGFGQNGQNPLVSWPLISGKTYQVQFKNDLNDPVWQDLPGDITFIGDTGYVSDPSPAPAGRFYRIVLSP
jgi:Tol biopolymer transport system component